jgi:hypothetical protein
MLIMFMDTTIGWVLDVILFEKEMCPMSIMSMDAVDEWVLDVSLSK